MSGPTTVTENKEEAQKKPDYFLLILGIFLLLIPLVFVLIDALAYDKAGFFLRVIAALGAGLVGAALPGFLHVELPFARAGGALAIFLLVYAVDPPKQTMEALSPQITEESDSSNSSETTERERQIVDNRGSQIPVAPSETTANVEWQTILGISWVKPSDWLGKHYFLTIEHNLYLWPTEIDEKNKKAKFIVNTSHASRSSGTIIVNDAWIDEGEAYHFSHNNDEYRITLVDIRQAGSLPTDATYVKAEKFVVVSQ